MSVQHRRDWRLSGYVLISVMLVLMLTVLVATPARSEVLLRACGIEPAETGSTEWDACPEAPVWQRPDRGLIVTALRRFDVAYRVIYEQAAKLQPGDRVWACDDPTIQPGSTAACPTKLPGVPDNWLSAGSVEWPGVPPVDSYTVTYRWQPVTQWSDEAPITELVSYRLTWWGTDIDGKANTPETGISTAGPPLVVQLPRQRVCAVVQSIVGDAVSDRSEPVCVSPLPRRPGVVSSVTVEFGSP